MSNQRVIWLSPDDPADSFPPVETALHEPDGLLAAGGDLGEARLLCAYSQGIFPWYEDGQPLLWWSPDPRCVFLRGDFHVSKRLRRQLRQSAAEIRINTAFDDVIRQCAAPRSSEHGTWITDEMAAAYQHLHRRGWAHSIEVWQDDKLVGGLYGIAIGKAFFGESMFSLAPNASKVALLFVNMALERGDFELLDCQLSSAHLFSLGARQMPRATFSRALQTYCNPAVPYENWPEQPLPCSTMSAE